MAKESLVMIVRFPGMENCVHLSKAELGNPLVDTEGARLVEQEGGGGATVTISNQPQAFIL